MVKLGFIGEGKTERMILESQCFREMLDSLNLDYVEEVADAKGGGNLIPERITALVEQLIKRGANRIVILTDLEDMPSIKFAKERVSTSDEYIIVIAVKAVEAWFLADTSAMSAYFKQNYTCEFPEDIDNPFEFVKEEGLRLTGRGVNSKRLLCGRMLKSGFSIQNAAQHPDCPSAAYFIRRLTEL